ncbi:hypothetical protein WQE_00970 [Paraburkholderia hospita]|uniref:Uncharacterized protein n=1 Tax=Paraburkholderia hospita TaxID=169430 RepID=A0AAN1JHX3_9BURK|nr:hypothetical protein C2L64_37725 [Paraburkholderia hospita]EIN02950.1 hypothetical protein WQE_00970 [Paraburkholderia hospita]OUL78690.1 hypothetical protein CA602_31090 [Paraburkholderia hospita]OUL85895.1 hypothetical protein CA601_23085 [Paraburkholderia hospita]SEH45497.1 hypothetical protein SAMN05192544_100245 [Paraburkholderia hospita]
MRPAKFNQAELEAAIADASVKRCEYGDGGYRKRRERNANEPHRANFWGKSVAKVVSRKAFTNGPV